MKRERISGWNQEEVKAAHGMGLRFLLYSSNGARQVSALEVLNSWEEIEQGSFLFSTDSELVSLIEDMFKQEEINHD
jgi:hypothetical protein